jgi:ribose transport system substrate-binding protein
MKRKPDRQKLIIAIMAGIMALFIFGVISLFIMVRFNNTNPVKRDARVYDKKYAFISNDTDDAFVRDVYNVAKEKASEHDAYLEFMGDHLSGDYDSHALMEIAIASRYDAIFVEADDSREMTSLINEAEAEGIPVITYMNDDSKSNRQSYVGSNFYVLGMQYGRELRKIKKDDTVNVLVLVKETLPESSKNSFSSSLMSEISDERTQGNEYDIDFYQLDTSQSFNVEEAVREIVLYKEGDVDVVLCLDEITTTNFYRALVDYNKVGKFEVIGYYNSETIVQGVERGVLKAAVSVDATEMGESCINAIEEYFESGYVSDYFSVGVEIIK